MSRVGSRIGRLEGRREEASRQQAGVDEREKAMAEDLETMRQTPEGARAERRYMGLLEERGRDVLRTEEGLAAARAFRDAIFGRQGTHDDNEREEQR